MKKLTTCLAALLLTAAPAAFAAAPPSGESLHRAPAPEVRIAHPATPMKRDGRFVKVSDKDLGKQIDKLEKHVTRLERELNKLQRERRRDVPKLRRVERELAVAKRDLSLARAEQRTRYAQRHHHRGDWYTRR